MPTASDQRALDPAFVLRAHLEALRARVGLPLQWPTAPEIAPSPKRRYRSTYQYQGYADLSDPAVWAHLTPFDLSLRLIDFSGLRPLLAQRLGWRSARGHQPFDPVSQFLLLGWQNEQHWNRAELLRRLTDPRYADYPQRFGFTTRYPTEGGVRYFQTVLGEQSEVEGLTLTVGEGSQQKTFPIQQLNQLFVPAMALILQAGVLSPTVWSEALLGLDGMLRPAAARMRCYAVTARCYEPLTPGATPPRPCPAKDNAKPEEQAHAGCACDTPACVQACRRTTPWDAEARFISHSGSNQQPSAPAGAHGHGKKAYGYNEMSVQLVDPVTRTHVPLLCDVRPANESETAPTAALLAQLPAFYACGPGAPAEPLTVKDVIGDAAFGQEPVLSITHETLRARRVLDLHAHACDKDKAQWPVRGYDDQGRPVCPYGYGFTANGFDAERLRHKWFCDQVCCKGVEPRVRLPETQYPPRECPARAPERPRGQILNVGLCFGDGSTRLVRDLVPGTPEWKALYSVARNASEGHNAAVQQHELKRMPVYGQARVKAVIFLHNVWEILTTLARLVREATQAWRERQAQALEPNGAAVSLA